jgi:hypothetical protein
MATQFYTWEEQSGGCDYTIGCGKRLTQIKGVKTLDEAIEKATRNTEVGGEGCADRVFVLEVTEFKNITNKILKFQEEYEEVVKEREREAAEARERAELERLSKKYGRK